jgi:hypothetical protein
MNAAEMRSFAPFRFPVKSEVVNAAAPELARKSRRRVSFATSDYIPVGLARRCGP